MKQDHSPGVDAGSATRSAADSRELYEFSGDDPDDDATDAIVAAI